MAKVFTVYDFRDAPMRVRASFESLTDAEEWGRTKLGGDAWIPPGGEDERLDEDELSETLEHTRASQDEFRNRADKLTDQVKTLSASARALERENAELRTRVEAQRIVIAQQTTEAA